MRHFITPPGLDLSPVAEHGNAVLLAWARGLLAGETAAPVLAAAQPAATRCGAWPCQSKSESKVYSL